MGIRGLKKWALMLTFWVALQCKWARATDLSGDNLTLTGTADIQGTTISLGTGSGSNPGWQGTYTDGTTAYIDFLASRSQANWRWWQNGSSSTQTQMVLGPDGTLVLYEPSSSTAKITLSPTGTSSFASSVTLNGADNQMPNQTLTGSNSVLTEALADGRYLSTTGTLVSIGSGAYLDDHGNPILAPTIGLNGGVASTGAYAFAEGPGTTATGTWSVAMGFTVTASGKADIAMGERTTANGYDCVALGSVSTASGEYSVALGGGYADGYGNVAIGSSVSTGDLSVAMGHDASSSSIYTVAIGGFCTASGVYSVAVGSASLATGNGAVVLGFQNAAFGNEATAFGYLTLANGTNSTASGYSTDAQAFDSFVTGAFNVGGGSSTSWIATDSLFEVGNGTDSSHKSNALTVYKNGNATLQGSFTAAALNTTGTISTAGLVTTGAITAASINSSGVITAAPGGDIPMFGH